MARNSKDSLVELIPSKTENEIWLSVIIPAYRVENYIEATITSVITEATEGTEIIIVDDCSPDASAHVAAQTVRALATEVPVTLLKLERNVGIGGARQKGLEISRGTYIWFVDSDDTIAKNSIKEIRQDITMLKPRQILWYPTIGKIDEQGKLSLDSGANSTNRQHNISPTEFMDRLLLTAIRPTIWDKIFPRELLKEGVLSSSRIWEDRLSLIALASLQVGVLEIPDKQIYWYRTRSGSITNSAQIIDNDRMAWVNQIIVNLRADTPWYKNSKTINLFWFSSGVLTVTDNALEAGADKLQIKKKFGEISLNRRLNIIRATIQLNLWGLLPYAFLFALDPNAMIWARFFKLRLRNDQCKKDR